MSESMKLARDLSNSELIAMAKKFYHPESPGYQIALRLEREIADVPCPRCGEVGPYCQPFCQSFAPTDY